VSRRLWRPAAATGAALALVAAAGGIANASAACPPPTVVSGTGTIFMSQAYIDNMAANDVVIVAQRPISVTSENTFTTTIWNLADGAAAPDLRACTGTIQLDAGSLVTNSVTGARILLDDIRLDLATDTIDYTVATPNGEATIGGLKLEGVQGGFVSGNYGSYSASKVFMTPTAAAALDSVLGTNAFLDTKVFGAFSATFKLSAPAAHPGLVYCG
jgi:hypothetical protein